MKRRAVPPDVVRQETALEGPALLSTQVDLTEHPEAARLGRRLGFQWASLDVRSFPALLLRRRCPKSLAPLAPLARRAAVWVGTGLAPSAVSAGLEQEVEQARRTGGRRGLPDHWAAHRRRVDVVAAWEGAAERPAAPLQVRPAADVFAAETAVAPAAVAPEAARPVWRPVLPADQADPDRAVPDRPAAAAVVVAAASFAAVP